MDWEVSRPPESLWQYVRQLREDAESTLFHDILVYCRDGPLPWNRLCLALSFPAFQAVIDKQLNSESEVSVSLPDFTVWQAKELLEANLPKSSSSSLHPDLKPTSVSYKLVPHEEKEEEQEPADQEDEDDFLAADLLDQSGDYESDPEEKPDVKDLDRKIYEEEHTASPVERKRTRNSKGVLISNDLADYTMVECQICGVHKQMTCLRGHTQSAHNMTITEYKDKFGADLDVVEKVLHRCGICEDLIVLDSDHIAKHLKKPGHNITHKNYNAKYTVNTKYHRSRGRYKREPVKTEERLDVKQEPNEDSGDMGGRRKRKRNAFLSDYELAVALSLGETDHEKFFSPQDILPRNPVDLEDVKNMKQLWKDCKVTVLNYKLTEEQMEEGGVDLTEFEVEESFKHSPVKAESLLPRVKVDSSHGRAEDEEVEKHMSRFLVGEKLIKECNICHYKTDRSDKTTMREHMFSHYPDICGIACPICRKPEKRKQGLMEHIEKTHSPEVLVLFGIEYIKQYEVRFDTNSEEQVNLRNEPLCKITCGTCKDTYYSADRMNLHIEMDLCKFVQEKPKVKREPKIQVQKDPETGELLFLPKRIKRQNLADDDSDFDDEGTKRRRRRSSDDEDFNPHKGGRANCVPGSYSQKEQLSIDVNIPGLLESLEGGGPYCCVIPTCEGKTFQSGSSLKRHYISHDPDMHAMFVCPECHFVKPDDHPGDMKKHIMQQHGKDEAWVEANVIFQISDKLKEFKEATAKAGEQRARGLRWVGGGAGVGRKSKIERTPVSVDDPRVRASFAEGGVGGVWNCGIDGCEHSSKTVYELKKHYGKHDLTLKNESLECNLCSFMSWSKPQMEAHQKEEHPEVGFLADSGESQFTTVTGERWEEFSDAVNEIVADNPNHEGSYSGGHRKMKESKNLQTINQRCVYCQEMFNDRDALEDHRKIHEPSLISFTCEKCQEGFAVQSVFDNHTRSHTVLYDTLAQGVVRCNGCSLRFESIKEVKRHLSTYHMNLLEDCNFCEHCSDFFTSKHLMRKHMFKHADKIFKCPTCEQQKFFTQEELDHHLSLNKCKVREDVECPHCGKMLHHKGLLKMHIRSIHEEKLLRYQCKICQCLYIRMNLVTLHLRQTHNIVGSIKDYYHFYSKEEARRLDVETLNANKKQEKRNKPVMKRTGPRTSCAFECGKSFLRSDHLRKHESYCQQNAFNEYNNDDSESYNDSKPYFHHPEYRLPFSS